MKAKLARAILQELDSDDELPDVYNEVSILPAYLDDHRFDDIKFPWLENISPLDNKDEETNGHVSEDQCHSEIIYKKGVLKGQDLYCLKSVESLICNSTLIWFLNFLLYKDLQSQYTYLKSCLVYDITTIMLFNKRYTPCEKCVPGDRYEIVIKCNSIL